MAQTVREHPYAPFLERVLKPSRYVGGEHGEIVKDWDAVDARLCLAFPDIYDVGMSHLGFKILYSIVNAHPKLLAERCYAPWTDMEAELRAHGEKLRSLETFHPLSEFDVVGFSLQFELSFSNILLMLDTGGVPLRSVDRGENDPLIIAGGPNATHPEPLTAFIDAFVIGDGEEKTPELLLTWSALKRAGVPRRERLVALAKLGGIYVPALYEVAPDPETGVLHVQAPSDATLPFPVQRAFLADISKYPFPSDGPVANTETVFDRVSVEIARGCTEGCRFCQAGMIYRPVRERKPEEVVNTILTAVREGGYDEASLTSLSTADYSAISPLVRTVMQKLEKERVSLSVSSLRAYGLTEELLDEIQKVRATGLTFAPEAGTQRMRDVVNKNVTEAQLMETAERVFSRGWSKMKLYFMIGLPTEEEEDVRGIAGTGSRAQEVGKALQRGRGPEVTVSVSTFVPKPHTPFQWCAMNPRDVVLEKQRVLRNEAKRLRVKLRMHDSEGSWLEGVLARGDRTLGDAIELAYKKGARFDCWEEKLNLEFWVDAFKETGVETARFLETIPVTAKLPWDHIDVGLAPGFLAKEYRKSLKNRLSPPCGKAVGQFVHHTNVEDHDGDKKKLVCYNCGIACDLGEMRTERRDFLVKLSAVTRKKPLVIAAEPDIADGLREPEENATFAIGGGESATDESAALAVDALADAGVADLAADAGEPLPFVDTRVIPKHRRPTAQFDQGRALKVRIAYTKLGRAAYRSHLDLVRVLPRMFRRLDLPMYYTQGFHPKPEMSFGPALPLGVASLAEVVEVKLLASSGLTEEEIRARLLGASLEDIRFTDAAVVCKEDESIAKVIERASYVAGLTRESLAALGFTNEDALGAHLVRKLGSPLSVVRDAKGIKRTIDVSALLESVAVAGGSLLREAGVMGDLVPLSFNVRITGQGGVRAGEVLSALFDGGELETRLVRTFMGRLDMSPLMLTRLRESAPPAPVRQRDTDHLQRDVLEGAALLGE